MSPSLGLTARSAQIVPRHRQFSARPDDRVRFGTVTLRRRPTPNQGGAPTPPPTTHHRRGAGAPPAAPLRNQWLAPNRPSKPSTGVAVAHRQGRPTRP